jgi:hypothetical protein
MRTGIFVYADSVDYMLRPEISAVIKYTGPGTSTEVATKGGMVTLTRGIYRLVTDYPTELQATPESSGACEIVAVVNNKDPWPDPPGSFTKVFPDVTTEHLRAFLPAGFDGFDAPAPAASSDVPARPVTG